MMQRDALHAFSPPGPRESAATLGRILLGQTAIGLLFAVIVYVVAGRAAGASALIGAAVCVVPNLIFAARLLPGLYQSEPHSMLRGLWGGEAMKLLATVALFFVVFRYVAPLRADMLFIGYVVTQFSMLISAWMTD